MQLTLLFVLACHSPENLYLFVVAVQLCEPSCYISVMLMGFVALQLQSNFLISPVCHPPNVSVQVCQKKYPSHVDFTEQV